MSSRFKYAIIKIPKGYMGVLNSPRGLVRTTLPQTSPELALESLGKSVTQAILSPDTFKDLAARLNSYFRGEPVVFHCQFDLSSATVFQKQVWETTLLIPYGETRSYAWVADQIGKQGAARAVGQALGRNPLPIIVPCHRVIAGNGTLCGFGGGLEMKQQLLELERSKQHE
jgi:methylated-DNA-[protein]-cysteine S-methyltransferase